MPEEKYSDEEPITVKTVWYTAGCFHGRAFEVELPLIRFFNWSWQKRKQYVCPDCKAVDCHPITNFVCSVGDGVVNNK